MDELQVRAKGYGEQLREFAETAFEVQSKDDLAFAAEVLQQIRSIRTEVEAAEKSATKPILEGVAKIRGWFAPVKDLALMAEERWKAMVTDYHALLQRKAEKAIQAASKGDTEALVRIEYPEPVAGLQTRRRWTFKVVDVAALPSQYLTPDTAAIRTEMGRQVKAGSVPELPGVEFYQIESVAVTG